MRKPTDYPFMKGLKLSELFYQDAVRPILGEHFPNVPYSAALIGHGSEVQGFDDSQSMDHDWGPRLLVFLDDADFPVHRERIDLALRHHLPREFQGYPTDLAGSTTGNDTADNGLVNHRVCLRGFRSFFKECLRFDPEEKPRAVDWLVLPEEFLRSFTAGGVFHDGLGRLEQLRTLLRYYPHDVWLYKLAVQWQRISQEEHFMGRCGQVGDELGSRLVASRLVHDVMRLGFLLERQYAPYIKWFGTAFAQLDCAQHLIPILTDVLSAGTWQEREKHLSKVYEFTTRLHNDLGISESLPTHVSPFYDRPFMVIHAERFAEITRRAITSEEVLALPPYLGGFDQFIDSTDILNYPACRDTLKLMFR